MRSFSQTSCLTFAVALTLSFFGACNNEPEVSGDGDGDGDVTGGTNGGDGDGDLPGDGDGDISLGGAMGDGDGDGDLPTTDLNLQPCNTQADCPETTTCKYDVCLPDLGSCSNNDDCPGDSYCDPDDICVPYGVDPEVINDPTCQRSDEPPDPIPTEQCTWDGSAFITDVYTTPMVADLNLDNDPNKLQPSVVITTRIDEDGERKGVLRIIDGRDCAEQLNIGDITDSEDPDAPAHAAQLAIGDLNADLDSDGRPEIVGLHRTAGDFGSYPPVQPIAWQVTGAGDTLALETLWRGHICGGPNDGDPVMFGNSWIEYGPGLFDLDDDGVPEIVIDKFVLDNNGCILNQSVNDALDGEAQDAIDALYSAYLSNGDGTNHKGAFSTVADVDLDGEPELVRFDGVYKWEGNEWTLEDYADSWTGDSAKPGHIAVADMGQYSAIPGHPATDALPEIIVVSAAGNADTTSTGSVRVMALDGTIVYGRDIPHTGCDTDDSACFGGHGGPPTASDFDGDGEVEFAAAANVYYTVYDPDCESTGIPDERPNGACENEGNPLPPAGQDDGILWAVESKDFSSSQTGSSIFDFDGNGQAEAVYRDEDTLFVFNGATGEVIFSSPVSSGTGMEYPTIVDVDGDFATEIVVGGQQGITILREPEDLWVSSRPIWNQHAYSITHVTDAGQIQSTSDWLNNWEVEGLNNFRQNTQGALGALSLADLTVELDQIDAVCNGETGDIPLYAKVCNRGTNPVQDGAEVAFFSKDADAEPDDAGEQLCDAVTETLLDVGDCTIVTCEATVPPGDDVFVLVDPEGNIPDCHPGNNDGSGSSVLCPAVK